MNPQIDRNYITSGSTTMILLLRRTLVLDQFSATRPRRFLTPKVFCHMAKQSSRYCSL